MNDYASKFKGLVWILAGCLIGVTIAAGLSPLAHMVPWSWEKKLGSALDSTSSEQECRANPKAEALLQQLVKRIYPIQPEDSAFSIDVKVVKSPVVNAYAMLGGKIVVNSGLLKQAESPEEVAGVLSHEIGHVHNRHIMRALFTRLLTAQGMILIFGDHSSAANWTNYFMTVDFTRAQEAQADEDGLTRLQKAHVDNHGFRNFFARMEKSGSASAFLSDHPSNGSRIKMVDSFPNDDVKPIMTPDDWKILKSYCGSN